MSAHTEPRRLEFETLISDTSALLMAASPADVDTAIETALDYVRTFFEAERCGLLTVSGDQSAVQVSHASCADGVARVSPDANLTDLFPWARQSLVVDRVPVMFFRTGELPPAAAVDRAAFEQMAVRSHLAVSILTGGAVTHIIVIHWVFREWEFPAGFVPRLRVLGEMMVNALQRRQAFEALRTSEERLDRAATAGGCGLWGTRRAERPDLADGRDAAALRARGRRADHVGCWHCSSSPPSGRCSSSGSWRRRGGWPTSKPRAASPPTPNPCPLRAPGPRRRPRPDRVRTAVRLLLLPREARALRPGRRLPDVGSRPCRWPRCPTAPRMPPRRRSMPRPRTSAS